MKPTCSKPKLVRWKAKDLASCFYSCRFPLEEEPDTGPCSPSEKLTGTSFPGAKPESSILKKTGGRRLAAEPRFDEEDFIVFCFRKDGAISVINEGRSSEEYRDENGRGETNAASAQLPMISKFLQLQCDCEECRRSTWDSSAGNNERVIEISENKQSGINDGEDWSVGWPPVEETEQMEQPTGSKMNSFESCESNLSDTNTSSSSFTFPALGIAWIGSPVHMPKWEDDATTPRLHCCRF